MTDSRISRIVVLIRKNFARDWRIKELAEMAKVSESQFYKLFKSTMGMSPCAFLREERLKNAAELLENDWEHISLIAYKVGIADLSHFTRYFKVKFGVTPTVYRENAHNIKRNETLSAKE